jgi:hypothetical protein
VILGLRGGEVGCNWLGDGVDLDNCFGGSVMMVELRLVSGGLLGVS